MLILSIALFLCDDYNDVVNKAVNILKKESDLKKRIAALDNVLLVKGLHDPRLISYYREQMSRPTTPNSGPRIFPELFIDRFFIDDYLTMICDYLSSHPFDKYPYDVSSLIEKLYPIRHHWWHSSATISLLSSFLKAYYHDVYDVKLNELTDNRSLSRWATLSKARSELGDYTVLQSLENGLNDKREVRSGKFLANVPRHSPYAIRVCDYSLLSLFLLGQADSKQIAFQYGSSDLDMKNFQTTNNAMFDKMISDYPSIREKYLSFPKR